MAYAYNRQGEPISIIEWSGLASDPSYRCVAFTKVGAVAISTVWLGIERGRLGGSMIFETRVQGGPCRCEVERYETECEALEGHELAIDYVSGITAPMN